MKRLVMALGALMLVTACTDQVEARSEAGLYTISLSARDGAENSEELVFLIRGEDGRAAAALIEGGASTVLAVAEAEALLADTADGLNPSSAAEADPLKGDRVRLELPGVSISADSSEDGKADRARVSVGVGKHRIEVDARDGDGAEQALVRIAGADAAAARKFIAEQEELSAEVRRHFYETLGL